MTLGTEEMIDEMTGDKTLSDEINDKGVIYPATDFIYVEDVKNFIKEVNDDIEIIKKDYRMGTLKTCNAIKLKIKKRAGKNLI